MTAPGHSPSNTAGPGKGDAAPAGTRHEASGGSTPARPAAARWRWRMSGPKSAFAPAAPSRWEPLLAAWRALQPREQLLIGVALAVLGAFLLWKIALEGPLQLLRQAPARLDALDAQTHTMQRLAAQSRELRTAAAINPAQSLAALQAASGRLGDRARLSVQGDRAVLTLNELEGEALRSWLAEVRSGARARATEAQLSRGARGFSGTVTITFGGQP